MDSDTTTQTNLYGDNPFAVFCLNNDQIKIIHRKKEKKFKWGKNVFLKPVQFVDALLPGYFEVDDKGDLVDVTE